jgi:hypothetical protein
MPLYLQAHYRYIEGNAEKQHMEGIDQNGNANMKMTEQG